jgi:hypothetical protein
VDEQYALAPLEWIERIVEDVDEIDPVQDRMVPDRISPWLVAAEVRHHTTPARTN